MIQQNTQHDADSRYNKRLEDLKEYAQDNDYWATDTNSKPTDHRIWLYQQRSEEKIFYQLEKEYEGNQNNG